MNISSSLSRFGLRPPNISRSVQLLLNSAFLSLVCAGSASAATLTWNSAATGTPTDNSGTWNLTATNWYNPSTTSNQVWNNNNVDTATFGATATGTASTATVTLGTNITAGGLTFNAGIYTYTIAGGTGLSLTLGGTTPTIAVNKSASISAVLAGSNGLTLTGVNTLGLTGAATYTGNTTILSGTLQPRTITNALPVTTTVVLGATGSTTSATLDVRAASTTVAGLSALGNTLNNKMVTNNQTTGTTTLIVNPDGAGVGAADSTFGGVLKDGTATNFLALTKAGSHTLTLSGTNTYTGATSVTGGALLINGDHSAATGNVTVAAGATLGGTGTIGGATTVTGMLSVGGSSGAGSTIGALTLSNVGTALTLNSAAATLFDINGNAGKGVAGGNDLITLTAGNLVYGGALNVSLNGFNPLPGATYDLFDFAGTQTGTFSSILLGDGSTFGGTFNYATGVLTVTAVPEPSTTVGGFLSLAAIAWSYRRRAARA